MKQSIKRSIIERFIAFLLRCHSFSYRLAGTLSIMVEPGGLHPKHRLMEYHQWFIENIRPEWSILDVGCGVGALAADLVRHCKVVVGIDISQENIKEAKKRSGGEFICADARAFSPARRFDAIVLSNVIEHIPDRISFLKRLSNYSSRFLIRVPMIDRDWITLYKKEVGVEYRLDPTHFIEYSLDSFKSEMQAADLEIESFKIRFGELYAVLKKT